MGNNLPLSFLRLDLHLVVGSLLSVIERNRHIDSVREALRVRETGLIVGPADSRV